jgi:hypothetical protein
MHRIVGPPGRLETLFVVFAAVAVLGGLGQYLKGEEIIGGGAYTNYNNYLIFKLAFVHLLENRDLYAAYPELVWDVFKYSPTFALLMAPLAILPDLPGLLGWNLLNALVLYVGVRWLPLGADAAKARILWFVSLELLISIQSSQSNGLVAGLVLLAFGAFERRHLQVAALCLALSFYVKIFGLVAAVLCLLHRGTTAFLARLAIWGALLGALPLVVVTPDQLLALYGSWLEVLRTDVAASDGLSVMGVLQAWVGVEPPRLLVPLAGAGLLLAPLARRRCVGEARFRYLMLASLLMWMVVFNHRAESPTYVIAMTGVAIWYWTGERSGPDRALLAAAFVLTTLSHTEVFPGPVKAAVIVPYQVKALPIIVIWLRTQYQLLTIRAGGESAGQVPARA